MESPATAATAAVGRTTVEKAVEALLKWKEAESKTQKPQLIPGDDFIYLNLTLKKIPSKPRTNAFRVPFPHPLHDISSELCLIIDDRPKSNLTSEAAKKIIKAQNIPVSKVIKLSKLKTNYKPFEAKRQLCDSYDLFLVDRRIVHLLPKLLGKQFFKKKKLPLPLDLTHKNWKEQVERACGSGLFFLRTGTCSVMKVGKASMGSSEIVDNVVEAIKGVVQVVPKKWGGVRSLHLRFSGSLALPLYQALPSIKLKIEGIKEIEKVGIEEVSDSVVKVKEGSEQKKGKSKGRIHEVRYMDLDTGVDDDDDEDEDENEMETGDCDENVENMLDGAEDIEEENSDEDMEDSDDDDAVKKAKKGKTGRSSVLSDLNGKRQAKRSKKTEKEVDVKAKKLKKTEKEVDVKAKKAEKEVDVKTKKLKKPEKEVDVKAKTLKKTEKEVNVKAKELKKPEKKVDVKQKEVKLSTKDGKKKKTELGTTLKDGSMKAKSTRNKVRA